MTMTIDFGDGIGDDPPPRHVNPTLSNDGYMAIGGQCVYVGTTAKQAPVQQKSEPTATRERHPDDDWIYFDTYCLYVGK